MSDNLSCKVLDKHIYAPAGHVERYERYRRVYPTCRLCRGITANLGGICTRCLNRIEGRR